MLKVLLMINSIMLIYFFLIALLLKLKKVVQKLLVHDLELKIICMQYYMLIANINNKYFLYVPTDIKIIKQTIKQS